MAVILTETGDRLVQETGFAVLVEVPVIPPFWIDLISGVPQPWQAQTPLSPITWTSVHPTGSDWTEIGSA